MSRVSHVQDLVEVAARPRGASDGGEDGGEGQDYERDHDALVDGTVHLGLLDFDGLLVVLHDLGPHTAVRGV